MVFTRSDPLSSHNADTRQWENPQENYTIRLTSYLTGVFTVTLARRNFPAIRDAELSTAAFVPHLDLDAVQRLIAAAMVATPGHGQRNGLLIAAMFDGCLRVSEALGLRPVDLSATDGGWLATVVGKGRKTGQVALSSSLVARLQAFGYETNLPKDSVFFPITRGRVHQIVRQAFDVAGISKPAHVGAVHVLRHSGAIARLEQTGNPKALQDQLRHSDAYGN